MALVKEVSHTRWALRFPKSTSFPARVLTLLVDQM